MGKAKSQIPVKEKLPSFISPMLASLVKEPFDNPDFIFEIKWDGYRVLAYIDHAEVNLFSRNNINYNDVFKPIVKALMFSGFSAVLDGEVVCLNDEGLPDFNLLQNYGKTRKGNLVYYIFDILYLNGHSMLELPLVNRKHILEVLPIPKVDQLQISKFIDDKGKELFAQTTKSGLEGIIAKNKNSLYSSGRSNAWQKIKNTNDCEAVVLGYTTSPKKAFFASLMLGYFENGRLIYCGHCGTGFSMAKEKELFTEFQKYVSDEETAKDVPRKYLKGIVWLKPKLVVRVQFAELTADGKMRHCSFRSLIHKNSSEITAIC